MLLGELIHKKEFLKTQVDDIKCYIGSSSSVTDGDSKILDVFYNNVWEYENCVRSVNEAFLNIEVDMGKEKKVSLDKIMVLESSLKEKIALLTDIIRHKCFTYGDVSKLISQKHSFIQELMYVSSLVNKTIWSFEIDNKSVG